MVEMLFKGLSSGGKYNTINDLEMVWKVHNQQTGHVQTITYFNSIHTLSLLSQEVSFHAFYHSVLDQFTGH